MSTPGQPRFKRCLLQRAAGSALLLPLFAHAAAYLPGADASPAEPAATRDSTAPAGSGMRWVLAPLRISGTVGLDLRTLRLEDGSRTSQALVFNDIDVATYLWQPWFAQLRAGLGVLTERDVRSAPGQGDARSGSGSLSGRLALSVFPASRFPFELRADVSDSRVTGDSLGADYRSQRLGLTQSWRPEIGNETVQLNIEHSRLSSGTGVDSVSLVQASAFRQSGPHSLDLNATLTRNLREDSTALPVSAGSSTSNGEISTLGALSLRHGWRPDANLNVDSLASWNRLDIGHRRPGNGSGGGLSFDAVDSELRSDLRQVSTFASWRPGATSLFNPSSPLMVSASLRWADSGLSSASALDDAGVPLNPQSQHVRSVFGSVGANQELGRDWRLTGSLASGLVQTDSGIGRLTRSASTSIGWAPAPRLLFGADWRYAPTVSLSATASDVRRHDSADTPASSASGDATSPPGADLTNQDPNMRRTLGLQLEHGASRSLRLDAGRGSLAFSLSQSLGLLHASPEADNARALAHGASVYWQSSPAAGDGMTQSYAGLSLSDARAWTPQPAHFQLVNLQFSQRRQLARHASWSGDLTVQASHNDVGQIDAFSGEMRMATGGWQRYSNGNLIYEDQRFLGVPRLRYTAILGLHSQQFESRRFGDIDAPRERISQSIENRLDYSIGRLETRLAARYARVDGRAVTVLQARVLRRY
jgi:hypothetical protein